MLRQETVQNPSYFADTLRAYRQDGYRVELWVMGVPEALSRQGILDRYHQQVRDRGTGRLTVPAKAAASLQGILDGADLVDAERLADVVVLYRRGGEAEPRYRNELAGTGRWLRPRGLRAAIETERSRPFTAAERAQFHDTQARLHAELGGEWTPELRAIDDLARPLLAAPNQADAAVQLAAKDFPRSPSQHLRPQSPSRKPSQRQDQHPLPNPGRDDPER